MNIEYLKLIKIDHDNNCVTEENVDDKDNVRDYVMSIIEQVSNNAGEREYEFKENELTMKTLLEKVIENNDRDAQSLAIANRLLAKENEAEQKYHQITEIQRGILLIAYCKMTDDEYKIVICKADYTEFIEEATGQKKNGLPTKKKIFKSFCANVTKNAGLYTIGKKVTFDVNTNQTKYWYDGFLDLKARLDDAENTKRAFKFIKSKILDPLREKHPHEHLRLWNITVGYMRSDGEFSIDYYADTILGNYHPEDGLDMQPIVAKVKDLPEQWNFDNRFTKVPNEIKSKIRQEYDLTRDIKLSINEHIPDLDNTILAYKDGEDNKYIMIRSELGYNLANRIQNERRDR